MKRILHFGGGGNINEQNSFKNNLNTYKTIVEDTLFGGDVISFFKSSSDPIEHVYSDYIDSLLQSGVSLMTFFGHSAANSFDFSVDLPENYENVGKYPFILSNGCYSGNIFFDGPNISTRFVIAEDKGAIGFYSSSGLSWAKYDHDFSTEIYRNISYASYGESIGSCIRNAINTLENKSNSGILTRLTCEEFTLHGDPSIPINSHARPDYYIDDEQLSTNPAIINVKHETFEINLDITNIGRAVTDSFIVRLERKFPGNSYFEIISEKKMASTSFKDNLTFDVITEADLAMGKNEFKISVDAQDSIYELSEMNNQAIIVVYILSDDLIPVSPYEFSMVPNKDSITLIASTANAFAVKRDYVMELDTTEYFDSPLLLTKNVTQVGGLVKWKNPPMPWVDSTVYYWRTSAIIQQKASSTGDKDEDYEYNWRYSSFIYLDGSSPGWNQSHFFQYAKDDFTNVEIPYSNRQIKFVDDEKNVQVNTFNMDYYPYSSPDAIFYRLNGVKSSSITCLQYGDPILPTWPESGLTIAVFDSITGQPVPSKLGVFPYGQDGELHWCGNSSGEYSASYWRDSSINNSAATLIWRNKIKTFMDGIPTGYYVLVFTVCSDIGPFMQTWDNDMYLKFENLLGSTLVRSVQNKEPWALFGKIGSPSWTGKVEMRADSLNGLVFFNAFFTGNWTSGYITSTLIGPAGRWGDLKWGHHANGSALGDEVNIDVVGVDAEGTEFPLMFNITATDTSLANINARDYPYIKLVCNIKDDSLRSARQLDYLRVYYDPLPEAALNPAALFLLSNDSLAEGEMFDLTVAVENISKYDMDSLLIDFVNTNGSGSNSNTKNMNFPRQDSLKKWETMNVNFTYNSFSYAGKNVLFIEVNPNDDQLEQYHFNNIGFIEYNVDRDNTNPLLDVTFDGVHIADGDLVSAKPHVEIQLKDENQFLALDDTSLITMWLLYPDDENSQPVFFASNIVTFIPASGDLKKKNEAKVQIDFDLVAKDGIYELLVEARDKSSNQSGNYDYKVSFEVVTNPSITNVYNYPNPFTTSTRFVFEVTGVVPPSYMKIQIMTVTGKVVKEINIDELGPLVIGQNITDYAWDGTDEFGDALANGVYLYRVVTKLDGQLLDFRASEGDEYFKTTNDKKFVGNIGKMVLIR
ncbi:MAG: hypothetical protein IIA45_09450 [Bacteroidetes bacterium]|nr:hypothetical protein [Bacteroidota bacterium]